jgi:hypothetical protein
MPEPMAMPLEKSSGLPGTRTPISDSALVRTRRPSWSLRAGSEPFSFRRNSRSMLPSAEAAKTTPRQVNRRGCFRSRVDFTVRTS